MATNACSHTKKIKPTSSNASPPKPHMRRRASGTHGSTYDWGDSLGGMPSTDPNLATSHASVT
jgi:hypothetical protein